MRSCNGPAWFGPLLLVIAMAFTAACNRPPEPSPPTKSTSALPSLFPTWPTLLNDFRFHWTAAPDIDLTRGPAVVVRAYTESFDVASMTVNIDDVYPGFMRATPENPPRNADHRNELIGIRPLWLYDGDMPPTARPHFGFNTDHLLELTATGDGFRAIVCTGSYSNFKKSTVRPDAYFSSASEAVKDGALTAPYPLDGSSGVAVRQIEFTQHDPRVPADAPTPVATRQRGRAPAPQIDVFGNWFITASSTTGWGPAEWDVKNSPSPELRKRCIDAMPHNEVQRREMMTGYKYQPPPHGNAVPGWPAATQ